MQDINSCQQGLVLQSVARGSVEVETVGTQRHGSTIKSVLCYSWKEGT